MIFRTRKKALLCAAHQVLPEPHAEWFATRPSGSRPLWGKARDLPTAARATCGTRESHRVGPSPDSTSAKLLLGPSNGFVAIREEVMREFRRFDPEDRRDHAAHNGIRNDER